MLIGIYKTLFHRLKCIIPTDRLIHDDLRTFAYGTDASFYRLIPKLIVKVENEAEVVRVLQEITALKIPVTFRSAGTSLSGQAITDSVLVLLGSTWTKYTINEDATEITLQPGIIGARANSYLARHGKKIGPDPASINAAMIGGIASNNASGMCCGTAQNTYQTLRRMRMVFHDGTVLDTRDSQSRKQFQLSKKDLIEKIIGLRDIIHSNDVLVKRIKHKYKIKNTTGYSINSFIDFVDPIDIIAHLMVGSEGTLGFISEITYATVPELPHKASSLMIFSRIGEACEAAEILKTCEVEAVELMDRASLRSVELKAGMPAYLKNLDDDATALLVQVGGESDEQLSVRIRQVSSALNNIRPLFPIEFKNDPKEYEELWNIRKGLFPSVGAMRATGTTCVIEDVVFPLPHLAEATLDLKILLQKHGYADAIIFGHALEGNLHFVFSQDFNRPEEVDRYRQLIEDVTTLVIEKYDGALKGEHGTGRNMAPFVEREWGTEAYRIMREIKMIFDPANLLNPDVIINANPQAHLKNIKPFAAVNSLIDKCIECGFCEVHCPSKDITLTPRQRITLYRQIESHSNTQEKNRRLKMDYEYFGDQTCATDGLCSLACPVGIDSGKLMKELRFKNRSVFSNIFATVTAKNFGMIIHILRSVLNSVDLIHRMLGTEKLAKLASTIRILSGNTIPQWNKFIPRGGRSIDLNKKIDLEERNKFKVVYFPACINRAMGISQDYDTEDSVSTTIVRLLGKAECEIIFPHNLENLCCGLAFDSKGFKKQAEMKVAELETALRLASNDGEYPILVDMSPCLLRMKETMLPKLQLFEPVEFILSHLVDRLDFQKAEEVVALHIPCSAIKLGLEDKFKRLANLCAEQVIIPEGIECCGWAGDLGFTHPEVNKSALSTLKTQIPGNCTQGFSTSRTCEIGLSLSSGISYKSIFYLVDRCTSGKRGEQGQDQD